MKNSIVSIVLYGIVCLTSTLHGSDDSLITNGNVLRQKDSPLFKETYSEMVFQTIRSDIDFSQKITLMSAFFEAGADINGKDYEGRTALHLLTESYKNNAILIKYLIKKNADLTITNEDGNTALHLTLKNNSFSNFVAIIKNSNPFIVNIRDEKGYTALHLACSKNKLDQRYYIVYELIRHGADVNMNQDTNDNALNLACSHLNNMSIYYNIVELLIQAGASCLNVCSEGYTPFILATENIKKTNKNNSTFVLYVMHKQIKKWSKTKPTNNQKEIKKRKRSLSL